MTDSELPVFSFRANWREPINERLSFMTDVLRSSEGAEQRRDLRPTPRRTFEPDFLLVGNERTFWDLFINKFGGGEMVAPLYWEVVSIQAALTATVSNRIVFDTTLREWQYHAGFLALLIGKSATDYEVVEIAAVDDEGVDLAAPVTRTWPVGTKLYPLRRCALDQVGEMRHPSAAVANVTAQLRVIGPNPWVPADDDSPTYGTLPVFLDEPNWVDSLSVDMDREVSLLDLNVGLTYQVDDLGRVLLGQSHRWFLPGREKLARFRDLIYRHKGRAGAFWLPTFKADLKMVASETSGSQKIIIETVGYGYSGGPTSGREYIAIKHEGGTILRRVTSVVSGPTFGTERVNLDAALGLALSPGQVRRISFADSARFDSDDFEITHFGGVDSHHEASARFRTFRNARTAPLPISFPIPAALKNPAPCGYPAGVVNIDANDFSSANRTGGGLLITAPSASNFLVITKPRVADSNGLLFYDAYSLWPGDNGPPPPPVANQTWNNRFTVLGSNGGGFSTIYSGAGLSNNFYTNADAAYNALDALLPMVFTGYTTYRVTCIVDPNLGDNRGGLSLFAYISSEDPS